MLHVTHQAPKQTAAALKGLVLREFLFQGCNKARHCDKCLGQGFAIWKGTTRPNTTGDSLLKLLSRATALVQ